MYPLYPNSKHQLVDVFTEGLNEAQFMYLIDKLGMIDIYSPA